METRKRSKCADSFTLTCTYDIGTIRIQTNLGVGFSSSPIRRERRVPERTTAVRQVSVAVKFLSRHLGFCCFCLRTNKVRYSEMRDHLFRRLCNNSFLLRFFVFCFDGPIRWSHFYRFNFETFETRLKMYARLTVTENMKGMRLIQSCLVEI